MSERILDIFRKHLGDSKNNTLLKEILVEYFRVHFQAPFIPTAFLLLYVLVGKVYLFYK